MDALAAVKQADMRARLTGVSHAICYSRDDEFRVIPYYHSVTRAMRVYEICHPPKTKELRK